MTREQIEELKKLDRAPDGSCWYCATVMRGHFEGCPVALLPRLLAERERLLAALRAAAVSLGDARSELSHCWTAERPPSEESCDEADKAEDAAQAALAFAEESAP